MKSWLVGKGLDAGEDWRRKETGAAEGEMVRQQHQCMDMSLSKLREIVLDREPGMLQFIGSQRVEQDLATEQQQQRWIRAATPIPKWEKGDLEPFL